MQLERDDGAQTSWREGIALTRDLRAAPNRGVEFYRAHPGGAAEPGCSALGIGAIQEIGRYHARLFSFGRALAPETVHGYAPTSGALGP
ncbi:MAG: hypothetical protein ACLPSH_10015 [Vulcanimicrobiaceae bacterium]